MGTRRRDVGRASSNARPLEASDFFPRRSDVFHGVPRVSASSERETRWRRRRRHRAPRARVVASEMMMMGKTLVETHRATRRARRARAENGGAVTRMKLSSRRAGRAGRVTARAGVKDVDIGVSATETTPRDGRRRVMNDGQRRARATRAMEEDARRGANSTGENVSAPRVARARGVGTR